MDQFDAKAPSPAPPLAGLAAPELLESDQTGPAHPSLPALLSSLLERADRPNPAAPAAGFEATETLATVQIRPEHDPAAALPHLGPDGAGAFNDGPDAASEAGAASPAQDLLAPGQAGALGPVWDELADRAA